MGIDMDISKKDSLFAQVLYEHFVSQGQNPFVIPIEHFRESGFNLADTKNALLRLLNRKLIEPPQYGWGFREKDEKTGKTKFVMTSSEHAVNDDDVEVYQIKIDDKNFPAISVKNNIELQTKEVSFDKKAFRISYGGNHHKFHKAKGRAQMFALLWASRRIVDENDTIIREGAFKPVWELAIAGKFVKDEQEFEERKVTADRSVRDAIQDFRDALTEMGAPIEILAQNGFLLVLKN